MNKYIAGLLGFTIVLGGCSKQVETVGMDFVKTGESYTLANPDEYDKYGKLKSEIESIDKHDKEAKVCALTTSTANLLYESGANLVAAPTSDMLNKEIATKLEDKSVYNLGSPLEPNLEQLKLASCDISFIADSMPHSESFEQVENLTYLPQTQYEDVFVSLYTLSEVMGLEKAQTNLSDMISKDIKAKEQAKEEIKEAAVLSYAMGSIYISDESSFVGSMVKELGIENIFADYSGKSMELSYEQLLAEDPEYIFLYGHGVTEDTLGEFLKNEGLKNLKAIKQDNVILLPSISSSADLEAANSLEYIVTEINKKVKE